MKLILGSNSPRRKEILDFFSLPYSQASPDFDEAQVVFKGDPRAFVCEVAKRKALCLAERFPNDIILTADTTVYKSPQIFQKPETLQEAKSMLKELSGQGHEVYTGVCIVKKNACWIEAEMSRVFFNELTEDQIDKYHSCIQPLDKAGGYAIQKAGVLVVKRIEGCYYNIMGLPIQTVRRLLLKAGIDLWDYLKAT